MSDDSADMGVLRRNISRYPHTVEGDGGGAILTTSNQSCRMIAIATHLTRYVQVLDSGISHISEGSGSCTVASTDIDIQRMTVTVECAAKDGCIASSHIIADRDVGIKTGIYPVSVLGNLHHVPERIPVIGIANDNKRRILTSGIAVDDRQFTTIILACPRCAVVYFGAYLFGCKETVLDGCRSFI